MPDAPEPRDPFGLRLRGIRDPRVLAALANVPRARFIPEAHRHEAAGDHPVPIGYGQTISQPFIVAWMTEALDIAPHHRVLEVGTGCGYQTAILAALAAEVVSLEVVPELSAAAAATLEALGVTNAELHVADGYAGWQVRAPYDRILLTAAPREVPQALLDQLARDGRLVAPVGVDDQHIEIVDRRGGRFERRHAMPVRFVPMVRK